MLKLFRARADERAALAFDDVASGLDSGLPPNLLGGDPSAGERVLPGLFARRGIDLDDTEVTVLVAAWRAGRAPTSLRHLAEQRRSRAETARAIQGALRYPLLLWLVSTLASVTTLSITHAIWLPIAAVALGIAAPIACVIALRRLQHGPSRLLHWPVLGPWAQSLGELPYLEVLRGLYGAGVPLLQAHPQALAACPIAGVREPLRAADAELQQGKTLGEALAHGNALHQETRHLLTTGEQAGALEDALGRALQRRRAVAAQSSAQLGRWISGIVYACAIGFATYVIVSFYGGYATLLRGLSHGR